MQAELAESKCNLATLNARKHASEVRKEVLSNAKGCDLAVIDVAFAKRWSSYEALWPDDAFLPTSQAVAQYLKSKLLAGTNGPLFTVRLVQRNEGRSWQFLLGTSVGAVCWYVFDSIAIQRGRARLTKLEQPRDLDSSYQ